MKGFLCALAAAALLVTQALPSQAVGTSAASAILVEAESGRVLYADNPDERRQIASITKLMTALVAVESGCGMEEMVTIQPEDTRAEGSSLYLKEGEEITLGALLYGLLLHSGNDAALAIARHCAGSVSAFVERMNQRALSLGMADSHFANPNGLSEEGHYSTARDMAQLARACLAREELAEIVATKSITVEGRSLQNHNKLLWQYEGCIGLKTGYTELAGRTLVSAAERDGMTLIAVTLNDPDDWKDHQALFDYGFQGYNMVTLAQAGDTVATLPVTGSLLPFGAVQAERTLRWPLAEGEVLEHRVDLQVEQLTAPVEAGTVVGTLSGWLNGQQVDAVPLVCGSTLVADVVEPEKSLPQRIWDWLRGENG